VLCCSLAHGLESAASDAAGNGQKSALMQLRIQLEGPLVQRVLPKRLSAELRLFKGEEKPSRPFGCKTVFTNVTVVDSVFNTGNEKTSIG